jgi:hypothetical protein
MKILGCVHIWFIHRCCTHNDQERETSSHQQSPYWNTGCLIYFFEFLPLRQKERFEPEAHLHGDIQSDLEFAGHPVLLFRGRFI